MRLKTVARLKKVRIMGAPFRSLKLDATSVRLTQFFGGIHEQNCASTAASESFSLVWSV